MEIKDAKGHKESIIALLRSEKLPVNDLSDLLENFKVLIENNKVIGVAGLEIYGDYALLRSLAVLPGYRGKDIATLLLDSLYSIAKTARLKAIYLLTETALDYFIRKGFQKTSRQDVPKALQQSSEFSHVCPESAIVMKKIL